MDAETLTKTNPTTVWKFKEMLDHKEVLILTVKSKIKVDTFEVTLNWYEARGDDIYFGFTPLDWRHGAWGCQMLKRVRKPFGLVSIERTGRIVPTA
jgi:hypothetical protein